MARLAYNDRTMPNLSANPRRRLQALRRPGVWTILLPACAALLVLAPALAAPFFWDDHVFLLLARRIPLSQVLERGLLDAYFRPLGGALVWLMARTLGDGVVPYHAAGAAVVAASAVLTATLVRRWTRNPAAAGWAGLLAALAPTAVISGAWLANIFSAVSCALGLAAMAAASRPVLAVPLALGAVLAKEDGVLWLPGVLLLIHAENGGTGRRTARSLAGAVAGLGALAVWRHSVLGGPGGVVPIPRLLGALPGGPLALVAGALAVVVLMVLVRAPLARAALPVALGGTILGLAMVRTLPMDPHGLWLRFFVTGAFGALLLAGCLLGAALPVRWAAALAAAAAVLCAAASLRWETHWLEATAASRRLADGTVAGLDARPAITGPVWIAGPGDEIALSAAVGRLRGDLLERVVPLRPRGINLVVCPEKLWRSVRPALGLSPLPGNPARVSGWVVAVGFARPTSGEVPVLRVGGGTQ